MRTTSRQFPNACDEAPRGRAPIRGTRPVVTAAVPAALLAAGAPAADAVVSANNGHLRQL